MDLHDAFVGQMGADKRTEQGGFAASAGAYQTDKLPALDGEVDVMQHPFGSKPMGKGSAFQSDVRLRSYSRHGGISVGHRTRERFSFEGS